MKINKNKFKLKKNGFTLIELLGIIIVLAVIAVITVPLIINVIDKAKQGAAKNSAYRLVAAANYYYTESSMTDENDRKFNGITDVLPYLKLEGKKPDKGKVYINEDGEIALAVTYDNTCITKYFNTDLYQSDDIENCGVNTEFTVTSTYVAFGGEYVDNFEEVIKTTDNGYVAVGNSNSENYDGLKSHGTNVNDDAIIVKYDQYGNTEWSKNFGGSGNDYYYTVIEEDDCFTAAGVVNSSDGDVNGISNGYAIVIVKYKKNNGDMISKKVLFTHSSSGVNYNIKSLIKDGDSYYALLKGRYISTNYILTHVVKYDENFNQVWINQYNDRYQSAELGKMIKTSNNTLVFTTTGTKNDGEMTDIYIEGSTRYIALFEISMDSGSILGKTSIGGENNSTPEDIIEVSDGYIISGSSSATTGNFLNLNKGKADAFIAKIEKTADSNGILPITWIKTFGGTRGDYFNSITLDGDNIIAAGYSYSSDLDMANASISSVDAIIVKYDLTGNVINTKTVGGTNNDQINDVILDGTNYIIAGTFFSTDLDMQNFNYGNSDAILMKLNTNLEPIESFQLRPVLLSKLPDMIVNYGTSIPTIAGRDNLKLYTTNNPGKDLGNWCSNQSYIDPNGNYNYPPCLKPLNSSDITTIYSDAITYENTVNVETDANNWIKLALALGNAGSNIEITNFKIKFKNHDATTIKEAVELGYIEPLVISGGTHNGNYFFENSYNILIEGNTGSGNYPALNILIKPKNIELEQITFTSNKEVSKSNGQFTVIQYSNFDISLTKAE